MCCAGESHRMELSSGLVLGLQPVGRKSGAVVHCHSEWALRVQCDGQSKDCTHWLFVSGLFGLCFCFFLFLFHNDTHTLSHTNIFFCLPRDPNKSSHKQSLTCLCFSRSLYFSFCLPSSYSCTAARNWRGESFEVVGGLTRSISQGACESHQSKKAQRDFHLKSSTQNKPAGSI